MSIDFTKTDCQDYSNKRLFGLCDDKPHERAYLDEDNGARWIAIVGNESTYQVTFTAVDNCIEAKRNDGKMAKRCDGFLSYNSTIIFVELKERDASGNMWVIDGERQLRSTIDYFLISDFSKAYKQRKAYICNSEHPKFKESQKRRMDQFLIDTGFVLRIENRIIL